MKAHIVIVLLVVVAAASAAPSASTAEDRGINGMITRIKHQVAARQDAGKVSELATAMKNVFEIGPDGHGGKASSENKEGK